MRREFENDQLLSRDMMAFTPFNPFDSAIHALVQEILFFLGDHQLRSMTEIISRRISCPRYKDSKNENGSSRAKGEFCRPFCLQNSPPLDCYIT